MLPLAARADEQWLLVSDLHVDPYAAGTEPSEYGSDTNWPLFESTLAAMRRADSNPAVVVITGDFLAHHFGSKAHSANPKQSTAQAATAVMKRIEGAFARAFPHSQFLIVLGNNDDPCGDYATAPGTAYMAAVARIWAPLVDRNGAAPRFKEQFARGGYYTVNLPRVHLRAVALDDVYWSIVYRSCGRGGSNAPANEATWFGRTLRETPAGARNVVLMHIPPGTDPVSTLVTHRFLVVPFLREGTQGQFLGDTSANAARIAFVAAGHLHLHGFRALGGVPILMAPAISPVYNNNPGFLRLQIAPDGTLRNYQLFAYDIWNGTWAQIFDFDRTYGARAFDLPTLLAAHRSIEANAQVRGAWAAALVAGSATQRVNSGNWRAYWCAQAADGAAYARCAGDQRRAAVLPIAFGALAAVVVLGLAALLVRLASQRRRA